MNGAKLCFSGTIAGGLVVAIGCGTSSSQPPGGPQDSGPATDTGSIVEAGLDAAAQACNPVYGQLCSGGQTCCFSGLIGTCVDRGTCTMPFQVSCNGPASCDTGVCCGSVQLPAGFDASAFDASPFDASGEQGFQPFDPNGFVLTLQCASACPAPGFQLCKTTQDCPSGYRCSGGPGEMGFGGVLACTPSEAGPGPMPDAEATLPVDGEAPDAAGAPVDSAADSAADAPFHSSDGD